MTERRAAGRDALWRRRTVRHMAIGLLPMLVLGTAVIAVLAGRFAEQAEPVRAATSRATATVERSGLGADRRGVELRWRDERGTERVSTLRSERPSEVAAGTRVELRYAPGDPTRVFAAGDEASARLRELAFGLLVTTLVVCLVVLVTAAHLTRRLVAERRPGTTMPVSYARSRRGIGRRSWLVVDDQGGEWWVPVHWDPVLAGLLEQTPATVHGRPARDRVVVVDVAGTPVWQAGRRRTQPPRGEITRDAPRWSTPAAKRPEAEGRPATEAPGRPIGLARQFRTDGALLVAAPLLGVTWAYVSDGGLAALLVATALSAAFLFWLPTVVGSDPT